jgi:hypothetical protein
MFGAFSAVLTATAFIHFGMAVAYLLAYFGKSTSSNSQGEREIRAYGM